MLFRGCTCLALGGLAFLSTSKLVNSFMSNKNSNVHHGFEADSAASADNVRVQDEKLVGHEQQNYGAMSHHIPEEHKVCLRE